MTEHFNLFLPLMNFKSLCWAIQQLHHFMYHSDLAAFHASWIQDCVY